MTTPATPVASMVLCCRLGKINGNNIVNAKETTLSLVKATDSSSRDQVRSLQSNMRSILLEAPHKCRKCKAEISLRLTAPTDYQIPTDRWIRKSIYSRYRVLIASITNLS